MSKYFLFICLLFLPLNASAHLLVTSKGEMLSRVYEHRQELDHLLLDLNRTYDLQTVSSLAASALQSIFVQNPKDNFLCEGLKAIEDLFETDCKKYNKFRQMLVDAAFHLEMMNFYLDLSQHFPEIPTEYGSKCYLNAIERLKYSEMLAMSIQDQSIKKTVSEILNEQKESLFAQFSNCEMELSKKISDESYVRYLEIDVLLECYRDDKYLTKKIMKDMYLMVNDLLDAEIYWGLSF